VIHEATHEGVDVRAFEPMAVAFATDDFLRQHAYASRC
jgi:hypothetical protein